jgi:hypothetical protein
MKIENSLKQLQIVGTSSMLSTALNLVERLSEDDVKCDAILMKPLSSLGLSIERVEYQAMFTTTFRLFSFSLQDFQHNDTSVLKKRQDNNIEINSRYLAYNEDTIEFKRSLFMLVIELLKNVFEIIAEKLMIGRIRGGFQVGYAQQLVVENSIDSLGSTWELCVFHGAQVIAPAWCQKPLFFKKWLDAMEILTIPIGDDEIDSLLERIVAPSKNGGKRY